MIDESRVPGHYPPTKENERENARALVAETTFTQSTIQDILTDEFIKSLGGVHLARQLVNSKLKGNKELLAEAKRVFDIAEEFDSLEQYEKLREILLNNLISGVNNNDNFNIDKPTLVRLGSSFAEAVIDEELANESDKTIKAAKKAVGDVLGHGKILR